MNVKFFPIEASIPAQEIAAAANEVSDYVNMKDALGFAATCVAGALGGGTVTFSFMQATSAAGAGAKAVSDITLVADADDEMGQIEVFPHDLDIAGGFHFVAVKAANVGGTGATVAAGLHLIDPAFKD